MHNPNAKICRGTKYVGVVNGALVHPGEPQVRQWKPCPGCGDCKPAETPEPRKKPKTET